MDLAINDHHMYVVYIVAVKIVVMASGINVSRHDLNPSFHNPCKAKAKIAPECLEKACGALALCNTTPPPFDQSHDYSNTTSAPKTTLQHIDMMCTRVIYGIESVSFPSD